MNKRIILLALVSTIGYTYTAQNKKIPKKSLATSTLVMDQRLQPLVQIPPFTNIAIGRPIESEDLALLDLSKPLNAAALKKDFQSLVTQYKAAKTWTEIAPLMTQMFNIKMQYAFSQLSKQDQATIRSHLPAIKDLRDKYTTASINYFKATNKITNIFNDAKN